MKRVRAVLRVISAGFARSSAQAAIRLEHLGIAHVLRRADFLDRLRYIEGKLAYVFRNVLRPIPHCLRINQISSGN